MLWDAKLMNPRFKIYYQIFNNDSSRRHYIVIAGRRNYYEINPEFTYSLRRQEENHSRITSL